MGKIIYKMWTYPLAIILFLLSLIIALFIWACYFGCEGIFYLLDIMEKLE